MEWIVHCKRACYVLNFDIWHGYVWWLEYSITWWILWWYFNQDFHCFFMWNVDKVQAVGKRKGTKGILTVQSLRQREGAQREISGAENTGTLSVKGRSKPRPPGSRWVTCNVRRWLVLLSMYLINCTLISRWFDILSLWFGLFCLTIVCPIRSCWHLKSNETNIQKCFSSHFSMDR